MFLVQISKTKPGSVELWLQRAIKHLRIFSFCVYYSLWDINSIKEKETLFSHQRTVLTYSVQKKHRNKWLDFAAQSKD